MDLDRKMMERWSKTKQQEEKQGCRPAAPQIMLGHHALQSSPQQDDVLPDNFL